MKFRFVFIFVLFSACQGSSEAGRIQKYFDSKSWLEQLITDLKAANPLVEKTWTYDGKTEKKQVSEIDWDKELKLFLDADLNKSSFVMSYDSVKEGGRTLYRLKPGENLPVKELSVVFGPNHVPVSLSCTRQSDNYFFTTGSRIRLEAQEGKLTGYEIRSVQRLLWFAPDSSYVAGKVIK